MIQKKTNLVDVIVLILADIDISLLKEEDQKTDKKDKLYTVEEIRTQLQKTCKNVCVVLDKRYDLEKSLPSKL